METDTRIQKASEQPSTPSGPILRELLQALPDKETVITRLRELQAAGKLEIPKATLALQVNQQFVDVLKPKSFSDCFNQTTPTLATLRKYRGNGITQSLVQKLIYEVGDFFAVKSGLTDVVVERAAEFILEDYYWLTIADLKYCFRLAMKGQFGKTFNRLDGETIIHWVKSYINERHTFAAQQAQELAGASRISLHQMSPKVLEAMESSFRKVTPPQPASQFVYQSIEAWCVANDLDSEQYLAELKREWEEAYSKLQMDMSFEDFVKYKYQEELVLINDRIEK